MADETTQKRRTYVCDKIGVEILVVANRPLCRYFSEKEPASCMFKNYDLPCPAQDSAKCIEQKVAYAGVPLTPKNIPRIARAFAEAFERTQRQAWDYP